MASNPAPIARASTAATAGEALIQENQKTYGPGNWQWWTGGKDGKFDILPGSGSDYTPSGVANNLVDGLKSIFTSEFMKRLAAALAGIAILLIVIAKFAATESGVV